MEIKIFSTIVTGMVETALNKLENQVANFIREKQVVSVNQSVIPATSSSEKTRIVITVVTK
mgnify:CR=1 FL=1